MPLNAKIDRLLDLLALQGGVLLALENVQVDAERLGLPCDAGLVGLEIVALRKVADQGEFHAAFVERRRRARDAVGKGRYADAGQRAGQRGALSFS